MKGMRCQLQQGERRMGVYLDGMNLSLRFWPESSIVHTMPLTFIYNYTLTGPGTFGYLPGRILGTLEQASSRQCMTNGGRGVRDGGREASCHDDDDSSVQANDVGCSKGIHAAGEVDRRIVQRAVTTRLTESGGLSASFEARRHCQVDKGRWTGFSYFR